MVLDEEDDEGVVLDLDVNDLAEADWLAANLDRKIVYDHTAERWYIWRPRQGRWEPDGQEDAQLIVTQAVKSAIISEPDKAALAAHTAMLTTRKTQAVMKALAWNPHYKTTGKDWDQNPYLLGVSQGIVDLRLNAKVVNPGPETLVTKTTGHRFVPVTDELAALEGIPRFREFLMQVMSQDTVMVGFLLKWFGYSLFGLTTEQKFLILTGTGSNGKGVLVEVMRHVFGEYSAPSNQNMYMKTRQGTVGSDRPRADLMALKGKRIAIMSEPEGGQFNENMLKAHTGGDPITARALNSNNEIAWTPTHTITFLTNALPSTDDVGPSMARRVMVADFNERFLGTKANQRLSDELKKEAPEILAALCFYAKLWYDSSGLVLPERVQRASKSYLEANGPLGSSITEVFEQDPKFSAPAHLLYETYCEWHAHQEDGGELLSSVRFAQALVKLGCTRTRPASGTVWTGIRPLSADKVAELA